MQLGRSLRLAGLSQCGGGRDAAARLVADRDSVEVLQLVGYPLRGPSPGDFLSRSALGRGVLRGDLSARPSFVCRLIASGPPVRGPLPADQDPGHTRTSRLQLSRIVAVSAGQQSCEACTTSTRRTCWNSAQVTGRDRSAPRNSRHFAAPVQSGARLTSDGMHLMAHPNERQDASESAISASRYRP